MLYDYLKLCFSNLMCYSNPQFLFLRLIIEYSVFLSLTVKFTLSKAFTRFVLCVVSFLYHSQEEWFCPCILHVQLLSDIGKLFLKRSFLVIYLFTLLYFSLFIYFSSVSLNSIGDNAFPCWSLVVTLIGCDILTFISTWLIYSTCFNEVYNYSWELKFFEDMY